MSSKVSRILSILIALAFVLLAILGWKFTHEEKFLTQQHKEVLTESNNGRREYTTDKVDSDFTQIADEKVPLSDDIQTTDNLRGLALETFNKLNSVRVDNGLRALTWDFNIETAAEIRAEECSRVWSHTRPNGKPFYTVDRKHVFGENLAMGYTTSDEAMIAWMNSPTHKENILWPEFKTGAISVYRGMDGILYWAIEFGY